MDESLIGPTSPPPGDRGWLPALGWLVAAIPDLTDYKPPGFCGKSPSCYIYILHVG